MRHVASLLSFVIVIGCGGDDTASLTDAGPGGSDGGGGDAGHVPAKRGWIDVHLIPDGFSDSADTYIYGAIVDQDAPCTHAVVANCEIDRCPVGAQPRLADPGKVRLPWPGGGAFAWSPGTFAFYFHADAIPWAAGETVTVMTDGAAVPAFSLGTPSPRTLDAGFDGPVTGLTLERTAQLGASWNATTGDVVVKVTQDEADSSPRTQISCTFAGSAGGGWVPAEALAYLSPTSGDFGDTIVAAYLATASTVDVGDWRVRLRALRRYDDQYKRYAVH